MEDRRAPASPPPREPGTFAPVAVGGRGGPLFPWIVVAALAVLVAALKPWGDGPGPPPPTPLVQVFPAVAPGAGRSAGSGVNAARTPTPAEADVSRMCLNTEAWLLASVERMQGGVVRVWRALEPARGLRPDDPTIPWVFIGSQAVTALGWCAPIDGPDRPADPTTVEAWSVSGRSLHPLALVRVLPVGLPSSLGALYLPSTDLPLTDAATPPPTAASWPAGQYVFRVRSGDGSVRTFGVDVEIDRPAGA